MLRNDGRCRRENFPHHGDTAGAGRADSQTPAGFGAFKIAKRLIFCFGNPLNDRFINGAIQLLIQERRGTRVSLLCSRVPRLN